MAEVIGITSGVITLVSLTLEWSTALYSTIKSFQSKEKKVRELRDEVKGLNDVLRTLEKSIGDVAVDIKALEQVLTQCCNTCKGFKALITKYTENSTDQRASIRDWWKLRYMGEDIAGFKNVLAGYKATITIALVYANIRTSKSTHDLLDEYKELIENTKHDLEVHLKEIMIRLQSTPAQSQNISEIDAVEFRRLEDERDVTHQCLKICLQASDQLARTQPTSLRAMAPPPDTVNQAFPLEELSLPWLILAEGFNSGQTGFISSKLRLQQLLHGINSKLQTTQRRLPVPQAEPTDVHRNLEEEVHSTKKALSICDKAASQENEIRRNFYEGISVGDDSQQFIVSIKDLISAKDVSAGSRSTQFMGQTEGTPLQHFARGYRHSAGEEGNDSAGKEEK